MDFMFQATIYELRRLPQVQILDNFHCHNSEFSARYKFYPTFFNGTWVSDTEILFRDRVGWFSHHFSFLSIIWYKTPFKTKSIQKYPSMNELCSSVRWSVHSWCVNLLNKNSCQSQPVPADSSGQLQVFCRQVCPPFSLYIISIFVLPGNTFWWRLPINGYGGVPHSETMACSEWLKMDDQPLQRWPTYFCQIRTHEEMYCLRWSAWVHLTLVGT